SHAIKGFAATMSDEKLEKVKADPRVLFVSEDREVSIDEKPEVLPEVRPTRKPNPPPPPPPPSQTLPTGIDRINAENKTNKGTGVNVAVIDTGIDLSHPD